MPMPAIHCTTPTTALQIVQPKAEPKRSRPICKFCAADRDDDVVREAQKLWDHYFNSVLVMFHQLNPDLNRDLALDRTVRALGQRPLTSSELLAHRFEGPSSGSTRPIGHSISWRDSHIARKLARESAFEDLCELAFEN